MAEDKNAPPINPNDAPKSPPPIIPLLNTIAILGALGLLTYSKLYFKRPPITEESERARLAEVHASPTPPPEPGYVNLEPLTVNISSNPTNPKPADGTSAQLQGKLHYVTVGISLEIRDKNQEDLIEEGKPYIIDKMISILGKKQFHELNQVQGRYILHTQIIDAVNQLINSLSPKPSKEGLITHVYFTQFFVQ